MTEKTADVMPGESSEKAGCGESNGENKREAKRPLTFHRLNRFMRALDEAHRKLDAEAEARLIPQLYAARTCRLPPAGWWCSRSAHHEGPCTARRIPCDGS